MIISNEKVHAEKSDMYVFHDKGNGTWFIKMCNWTSDSIICDQRLRLYFHISVILWKRHKHGDTFPVPPWWPLLVILKWHPIAYSAKKKITQSSVAYDTKPLPEPVLPYNQ